MSFTIDAPTSPDRLMAARDALAFAEETILAIDEELTGSLRVRRRAGALRERAGVMISEAQLGQIQREI